MNITAAPTTNDIAGQSLDALAKELVDKPTNVNNRFQVAAKMNRLMTDQPWPFWGCPANDAQRWLSTD